MGFKDHDIEALLSGAAVKRWANIQTVAMRKLAILKRAATLRDLRILPQKHLEFRVKDPGGQHGLRIDAQWRICFRSTENGLEDVEICDDRLQRGFMKSGASSVPAF